MPMPGLFENGRHYGLIKVTLLTLIQGAAAGSAAFATRGLFEALHQGEPLPFPLIVVLIGSGLVIYGARVAARLTGERLGQEYALAIRLALLEHAAGMPASAVAGRRSGFMSLRFVGDMTAFRNWLGRGLPQLIAGSVMIPSACLVLWLLNPAFAFVTIPIFALALGMIAAVGPRLKKLNRRLRTRRARIAADMAERMPLAPELDRMGRRPTELHLLKKRTKRMISAGLDRLFYTEMLKALPDAIGGFAAVAILIAGSSAGASTGAIAGALAALGLVLLPMRDLAVVWNSRAAYLAAREKCVTALGRSQRGLYAGAVRVRLPGGPASLSVSDLGLAADEKISLDLPAGACHTLTCSPIAAEHLFSTLCGLERVTPGQIRLSGICLTNLSRASLRRGVLWLSTQPAVLKGTLRRNLALGLTKRSSDRLLERAARMAGLKAIVEKSGLDGNISEGARGFSAAERAALSLARIFLCKPKLLLLDGAVWHLPEMAQQALCAHIRKTDATLLLHPDLSKFDVFNFLLDKQAVTLPCTGQGTQCFQRGAAVDVGTNKAS